MGKIAMGAAMGGMHRAVCTGRYNLRQHSYASQECFETMLRSRLLPLVQHVSHAEPFSMWAESGVQPDAFGADRPLQTLPFWFRSPEPAVNRCAEPGD